MGGAVEKSVRQDRLAREQQQREYRPWQWCSEKDMFQHLNGTMPCTEAGQSEGHADLACVGHGLGAQGVWVANCEGARRALEPDA